MKPFSSPMIVIVGVTLWLLRLPQTTLSTPSAGDSGIFRNLGPVRTRAPVPDRAQVTALAPAPSPAQAMMTKFASCHHEM